ncbi:hypothetical protein M404DRAFT_156312 [Pisolithus tinctorius Marx 270]|uniref:Uncharacterized protein n=1 Tax=Pisolithus tinctorius Marx 270 TaxID=870435 RepID=A0A0C3NUV1_PISTI|nr:hypothetical protein M404DRAFT_156312 [Pisolithus tinctorius Marx 270]
MGGPSGDVAVVKGSGDDIVEMILSGIFEIDRQGFFMGPEGGFFPSNAFNKEFVDTKLSCNLIAVRRDSVYGASRHDFPAVVANLRALEKLIPSRKGETVLSCVREARGQVCIRLNHTLFVTNLQTKNMNTDPETAVDDGGLRLMLTLSTEMRTTDWPVQERLKGALARAAETHNISPLPVFDLHGESIDPSDYTRKLSGAIVRARFALMHYSIGGDKKSVFMAVVRDMVVLREPVAAPVNPLKRGCGIGESGVSSSGNRPSKNARRVCRSLQSMPSPANDDHLQM